MGTRSRNRGERICVMKSKIFKISWKQSMMTDGVNEFVIPSDITSNDLYVLLCDKWKLMNLQVQELPTTRLETTIEEEHNDSDCPICQHDCDDTRDKNGLCYKCNPFAIKPKHRGIEKLDMLNLLQDLPKEFTDWVLVANRLKNKINEILDYLGEKDGW